MFTSRWNGWMNGGYVRSHVELNVYVVLCGNNKGALQIFEKVVVVYRKIKERLAVFLHFSNGKLIN